MPPRLKDSFKEPSPEEVKKFFNAVNANLTAEVFATLKANPRAPEWRDRAGNTPLMMAVIHGPARQDIIDMLIEFGADVNAQNKHGGNALARAAHFGHEATVLQLLKLGADINMKDALGQDAADWAKMNGHADIVDLLEMHKKPDSFQPPKFAP
jgi:ankyrin repeat protein